MNTRVANKRTNLGKMYLVKINTSVTKIANANTTWLIKKKGTNWGIVCWVLVYCFQTLENMMLINIKILKEIKHNITKRERTINLYMVYWVFIYSLQILENSM
jgi:hypothetical protein